MDDMEEEMLEDDWYVAHFKRPQQRADLAKWRSGEYQKLSDVSFSEEAAAAIVSAQVVGGDVTTEDFLHEGEIFYPDGDA